MGSGGAAMLYIVDGTGPADDTEYSLAMAGGHCRLMAHRFRSIAHYERGPAVFGFAGLGSLGQAGLKSAALLGGGPGGLLALDSLGVNDSCTNQKGKILQIIQNRKPADRKIYLCGYSRGGATVISICAALNRMGREVEALFLFDPVDSDATLSDTAYIPGNVKKTFMAYRDMRYVRSLQDEADRKVRGAFAAGGQALKNVMMANVIPQLPSILPGKPVAVGKAVESVADFGRKSADAVDAQIASQKWRQNVARDLMFDLCVKGLAPDARRNGSVLHAMSFKGTHGAMGGCPRTLDEQADKAAGKKDWALYPDDKYRQQDLTCAKETYAWLQACIYQTNLLSDIKAGI